MVRFTRARTHVHMCMYTIQRYWYDMIHDISKLRIFPIWRIWVHIIWLKPTSCRNVLLHTWYDTHRYDTFWYVLIVSEHTLQYQQYSIIAGKTVDSVQRRQLRGSHKCEYWLINHTLSQKVSFSPEKAGLSPAWDWLDHFNSFIS